MKYALTIAEDSRILSATFEKFAPVGAVLVDELPDGNIADYLYQNGDFIYSPVIVEVSVEQQIAELKAELASTDYKIIKCSEAQLVGEELPYDIITLHAERQALREEINALEAQ